MKLQNKMTVSILLIIMMFIVIISSEQILLILPKFQTINIQKAYNNIDEGLRVIDDERSNMSIISSDYAVWDDTYLYTQNKDDQYIKTNFTEDTLNNLNMSFVGVYGADGFLFSLNTLADKQEAQRIQQEIMGTDYFKQPDVNGFITVGEKTYMFATKQISTTDESTTSNYYFTFIRDYIDFTNAKLGTIPGASLEILDFQTMTDEEKQHIQNLHDTTVSDPDKTEPSQKIFYEIPEKQPILAYSYLTDIKAEPFAVLQSKTDTSIIAVGLNSVHQTGMMLTLFGITIAVIMTLFVRRSIIKPLNRLKNGLDTLLDTRNTLSNTDGHLLVERTDEIGEVYEKFLYVSAYIKAANQENERMNSQLETLVLKRTKELKAANEELILYGESFEETSEGLVVTDPDGKIIMCNKSYALLSGYKKEELYGQNPSILKSDKQDHHFYANFWHDLRNKGNWEGEVWNMRKDGQIIPIWLAIDAIRDTAGMITHYIGALSDMTIKKDMENQLEKMAFYDSLTGLPNRTLFYSYLQKAMSRAILYDFKVAVLFIDLDGFKLVNDTFGHSNGDLLLIEVGKRISHHIRESDLLSRWGGDEFTVVLENIKEKSDVIKIASDLLYNISRDIIIAGEYISIGASVGIALFPDDGETIEEIMIKADAAMYTSKSNGKNCYTFASTEEKKHEIPKIIMINQLKKAIKNHEFDLVYQPQIQVDANENKIFGAESLIRWTDESGKSYMPDEFIGLAEETGMINEMGQWVIEEACRTIRELNDQNIYLPISVNVSTVQFKSKNLIGVVKDAIEKNHIDPKFLYMEITESVFADDELKILESIQGLKALGVKIILDDFGKGYSSLSLISQLPFDLLKIDKSFTQNIVLEKERKLVTMIISIGEILNIQSIIEGVETREQVEYHSNHGGSIYQGYFFSGPLDKNDFMDLCLGKWTLENLKEF